MPWSNLRHATLTLATVELLYPPKREQDPESQLTREQRAIIDG